MALSDSVIEQRKEHLVSKLAQFLLPLRHDSRLCSGYIYGQLSEDWDIDRVVHECCLMHWLYSYTAYPLKMREAYMYFSTILTSGKSVHEFIKHNVQPHIKGQIIVSHGGVPSHWPWLPWIPPLPPVSKESKIRSGSATEEKEEREARDQEEQEKQEEQEDTRDWLILPNYEPNNEPNNEPNKTTL